MGCLVPISYNLLPLPFLFNKQLNTFQSRYNFHPEFLSALSMMISSKKLRQMAKRWAKAAGIGKKIISLKQTDGSASSSSCSRSALPASKGHFVVYTNDQKRFTVPLTWLTSGIFGELLRIAEEEFGLPTDGPITLPCDAVMESIRRHSSIDFLQSSMGSWRCSASSSFLRRQTNQQPVVRRI